MIILVIYSIFSLPLVPKLIQNTRPWGLYNVVISSEHNANVNTMTCVSTHTGINKCLTLQMAHYGRMELMQSKTPCSCPSRLLLLFVYSWWIRNFKRRENDVSFSNGPELWPHKPLIQPIKSHKAWFALLNYAIRLRKWPWSGKRHSAWLR